MAKLIALSLSLCFLLFSGCLALRQQPEENECQFNRINALEPDNRIESEAGLIETWNPFTKQFRCAGVAFSRCTLQRNALRRPFYSNSPQEIFIQQGSGYFGMIFPGCPSTYEEPQESQRERGQGQSVGDRHQKVHKFREGDVIAVPTGVAFWMFNEQETPVVAVSVIDTSSIHNQLDQIPRRFYLAGNQENEFLQYVQEQSDRRSQIAVSRERQQSRREGQQSRRGQQGQEQEEEDENENGNVLSGFSPEFLEQAFQINREIVRSLQGKNEDEEKGAIVKVKGGLSIITPPMRQQRQQRRQEREEDEDEDEDEYDQQQQQEEQQRRRRRPHHGGRGGRDDENGLEETLCTLRLRSNIGQRASPDIYNPQAGRVRVVNDLDFPALRWLGLSAEYGSLNRNAMFVPHYNLNANSILYVLSGRAHVQIVDCSGNTVFDGELEEGRVLTIPQNFVVAAKALSEHFRYVAFKTSSRPSIATLAGSSSLINAMPEEVVAQSFGLRREQARQLKNNNPFKFLVPPQSQMRAVA